MRQDYFMALALAALFPSVLATSIELEARAAVSSSLMKPTVTPPTMPTGSMIPMSPLSGSVRPSGSMMLSPPQMSSAKVVAARAAPDSSMMKPTDTMMPSVYPTGSMIPPLGTGMPPAPSGSMMPPLDTNILSTPSEIAKSVAARAESSSMEKPTGSMMPLPPSGSGSMHLSPPSGTGMPPPPPSGSMEPIAARAELSLMKRPTGSMMPPPPSGTDIPPPSPSGTMKSIAARAESSTIEMAKPSGTMQPRPMKHANDTNAAYSVHSNAANGTHMGGQRNGTNHHRNTTDAAFASHSNAAGGNGTRHSANGTHHDGANSTTTTTETEAAESTTKDSTSTSSTSSAGRVDMAGSMVFGLIVIVGVTFL